MPKDEVQPVMVREQKPSGYTYGYTYEPFKPTERRFRFSHKEVEHLSLAAILVVGVGLSLDFEGGVNVGYFLLAFSVAAFTASFLVHELAHKAVAQRHGLWAEFRLTLIGGVLTAVSILPLPIKFISPGAVMVAGAADVKTMGKTAVAGPLTNIVLAMMLSVAATALPPYAFSSIGIVAWFNAWIAAINLIPFSILDGMKVYVWNKKVWALGFAASAALTVVLGIIFLG